MFSDCDRIYDVVSHVFGLLEVIFTEKVTSLGLSLRDSLKK